MRAAPSRSATRSTSSACCWRGRVRLTERGGGVEEYGTGDGFVIPAGFEGTWETLEPVRKWYVIFEANAG
jgi:uncharacterized cupin superfamily protein